MADGALGKGIATEAARGVLKFAFDVQEAHRVEVSAAVDNLRSLATIERLGFQYEGTARHREYIAGRWLDHAVYGMLSTDLGRP